MCITIHARSRRTHIVYLMGAVCGWIRRKRVMDVSDLCVCAPCSSATKPEDKCTDTLYSDICKLFKHISISRATADRSIPSHHNRTARRSGHARIGVNVNARGALSLISKCARVRMSSSPRPASSVHNTQQYPQSSSVPCGIRA